MVVIVHQAPGVTGPAAPFGGLRQQRQKPPPVVVIDEDIGARIAPRGDVVHRTRILDTQGTGHGERIISHQSQFKT
jgi:hypothetical protein